MFVVGKVNNFLREQQRKGIAMLSQNERNVLKNRMLEGDVLPEAEFNALFTSMDKEEREEFERRLDLYESEASRKIKEEMGWEDPPEPPEEVLKDMEVMPKEEVEKLAQLYKTA